MGLGPIELGLPRRSFAARSGRPASSSSSASRSTAWPRPGARSSSFSSACRSRSLSPDCAANQARSGEDLRRRDAVGREALEGLAAPRRRRRSPWPGRAGSSRPLRLAAGAPGSRRASAGPRRNRPVRMARLARPSQIRSSSGELRRGGLQGGPDHLDRFRVDRVEGRQLPEQAEPVGVGVPASSTSLRTSANRPWRLNRWTSVSRASIACGPGARMAIGSSSSASANRSRFSTSRARNMAAWPAKGESAAPATRPPRRPRGGRGPARKPRGGTRPPPRRATARPPGQQLPGFGGRTRGDPRLGLVDDRPIRQ